MNYFLVITSPDYPVTFNNAKLAIMDDLNLGRLISRPEEYVPLQYKNTGNTALTADELLNYDVLEALSGGILVSRRAKELMEAGFPGEVQFLEAVIDFEGKSITGYFAMNVYTRFACYDLEASKYEVSPVDRSYDFDAIALMKEPMEEHGREYHIVRSVYDNKIAVSDTFREFVSDNQINSLEFDDSYSMEW